MYAVMGVTGKVGSAVARGLIHSGARVRAVMRDATKARVWTDSGCEVAIAKTEEASPGAARCSSKCSRLSVSHRRAQVRPVIVNFHDMVIPAVEVIDKARRRVCGDLFVSRYCA